MPARHECAPECDRGKGMSRLPEGSQEEPPPRAGLGCAQSASASARMIFERPSTVGAIGVVISVPTPASR